MNTVMRVGLAVLLTSAGLGVGGCTQDESDPYKVSVGQCLKTAKSSGTVDKVDVVDCTEPHAAEAYATVQAEQAKAFPGSKALQHQAGGCAPKFKDFIGKPYDQSDLKITYFHPTDESWKQGDREILCIVSVPTGTVKGSLKGSSR